MSRPGSNPRRHRHRERRPGAGVRWRQRPFLCFGAVDWSAKVWVNGRFAGEHAGGYTPFALDVSRYVRPGPAATLTVRAWDTSAADTPIGKQVERWYTHSGGIWQPVWLEGRPEAYITRIQISTTPDLGAAAFEIGVAGAHLRRPSAPVEPSAPRVAADGAGTEVPLTRPRRGGSFPDVEAPLDLFRRGGRSPSLRVAVPDPALWSPESPHLYDCVVTPRRPRAAGGRGGHVLRAAHGGAAGAGGASPTSTSCSTGPRSTCAGPSTRPSTRTACTPTPPTPPSAPTSRRRRPSASTSCAATSRSTTPATTTGATSSACS